MNSHVFQITKSRIFEPFQLDANALATFNNRFFEYCYNLSQDERLRVIRQFVNECLPSGMFTLIGNDVVRYNGGFREWFKCWTEKLHELSGNIAPDTVRGYFGSSYNRLKEFIENPLEMPVKFYLCEDGENRHCDNAADFMRSISELREGDCLYIGAVLGYYV